MKTGCALVRLVLTCGKKDFADVAFDNFEAKVVFEVIFKLLEILKVFNIIFEPFVTKRE